MTQTLLEPDDPNRRPVAATVDFATLQFHRNDWGQLVLELPGGIVHAGVEPVRCFPLSDPDRTIAIVDAEGRELVNLPSLDVLNAAAADLVRRELAERDFTPTILRIVSTSSPSPPCRWDVETDRGTTAFQLESEDDVRKLGNSGAVIADANGIRYLVPEIHKLDAYSQRTIRRLI
jgi:hypothetical protein